VSTSNDSFLHALGMALRERRLERRLSQQDLANLARVHPRRIWELERGGRNPGVATVRAIAEHLDLSLLMLIARAELLASDAAREQNDAENDDT
jgi:transcriptional regulator with XRE-family HTH domain